MQAAAHEKFLLYFKRMRTDKYLSNLTYLGSVIVFYSSFKILLRSCCWMLKSALAYKNTCFIGKDESDCVIILYSEEEYFQILVEELKQYFNIIFILYTENDTLCFKFTDESKIRSVLISQNNIEEVINKLSLNKISSFIYNYRYFKIGYFDRFSHQEISKILQRNISFSHLISEGVIEVMRTQNNRSSILYLNDLHVKFKLPHYNLYQSSIRYTIQQLYTKVMKKSNNINLCIIDDAFQGSKINHKNVHKWSSRVVKTLIKYKSFHYTRKFLFLKSNLLFLLSKISKYIKNFIRNTLSPS
jgi:hypothetical protein